MSVSIVCKALTRSGWVSGAVTPDGAVEVFKGIPFAAPPTGRLRWRPPQPVAPWQGIRPATEFGPRCIQPGRSERSIGYFGPETESEDCLYLNIWTPGRSGGDPNGDKLPNWPVFAIENARAMLFGNDVRPEGIPDEERLKFRDTYFSRAPRSR